MKRAILLAVVVLAGCGSTRVVTQAPAPSTHVQQPATGCHVQLHNSPDPVCTPGALNPDVDAKGPAATICVPGYSKTVRPPANVTGPWKVESMRAYGLDPGQAASYEYDHLIAIEDGGAPADKANIWPQARSGAYPAALKDDLENYEHKQLCSGKLSLIQVRSDLLSWEATVQRLQAEGVDLGSFAFHGSGKQNVGG